MTRDHEPDGSRVEAAAAGVHAEAGEVARDEHVTAADAVTAPAHPHHHPVDPNEGLERGARTSPRGALAAVLVGLLTLGALAGVAYAVVTGAA